jgi:hypothetical protein
MVQFLERTVLPDVVGFAAEESGLKYAAVNIFGTSISP